VARATDADGTAGGVPAVAATVDGSTAAPRSAGMLGTVAAGLIIGAVEAVLAIAFAALVFGGYVADRLPDGIGLYLVAAAFTLAFLAWRAGRRGVVGSVQDAAAVVLGLVAQTTAAKALNLAQIAQATGLKDYEAPDVFLTVVAATLVVTVLCGVLFWVLGRFRLGNLVRYVPYPVVGGFLAGTGWLLLKSGLYVASGVEVHLRTVGLMVQPASLVHWLPAFLFGALLLLAVRIVKKPQVIPIAIGAGLAAFVLGALVTGSSLDAVREGRWLLGPFESARLWQPWTFRAIAGADWSQVLGQWAQIVPAVLVASLAILFNISGSEVVLGRTLDTNRELRDAGALNVVSGAIGGIPGYHALSLTALAERMKVDARAAGLIAAIVPLSAVVFGASVIALIPRMLVGGVLVFLGLAFLVEWVWDERRKLPWRDYAVVVLILAGVIAKGFLPGVVLGLVLALVLFAVNYGRIELVQEVAFGETFRSNVDRAPAERAFLRSSADRVQVLRVRGFVFFGTASRLLERIRERAEAGGLRLLVLDLRRVSGVDSSAVVAFRKAASVARAGGFELVLAGLDERTRDRLARGGVVEEPGVVAFEPDLDRGLERCESALLAGAVGALDGADPGEILAGMPPGLEPSAERIALEAGAVLLRQGEPSDDVFILASGRLRVEVATPDGVRMRLRTVQPGVVVGEVALYTGTPRTADVVAEIPSVVLRLSRASIARLEADDPEAAAALHRWLATTVSERLTDSLRTLDALID
jgi:sulfate permease, SulP family